MTFPSPPKVKTVVAKVVITPAPEVLMVVPFPFDEAAFPKVMV
jgi:hypothetical protein